MIDLVLNQASNLSSLFLRKPHNFKYPNFEIFYHLGKSIEKSLKGGGLFCFNLEAF